MTLFLPPNNIENTAPVIFLAGPIQGAADWQADAIRYIDGINSKIQIASPRRGIAPKGEFSDAMYYEQVGWEHRHLELAARNGVILFWLAKEAEHNCERAYAQTTRLELGIALGWHQFRNVKVVVGVEEGFSNARYIRYTIGAKYPDVPVLTSLEQTCTEAVSALAT